jgi:trimethylamine--corrinoid protein Co-methyltransferase
MIESDSAESLFDVIERGAPVVTLPCPMGGGTSPYSLAGTLAMHTAESLFIITACQAIQQDHPVIYGGVPSTMDMRTGNVSYGNPELAMMFAGMAQVAHYFGLPVYAPIALADSKEPDMQAGYEKMRAFLLARLGGLNFTQCSGLSAAAMSIVTEQLVIEHEILCSVERIFQGISVNDKSIGWDAIKRTGTGGHFLMDDHTVSFLGTQEHFENKVADRSSLGGSGKNICEKAYEVASQLETEHRSRVEDNVVLELKKYVEKYNSQK